MHIENYIIPANAKNGKLIFGLFTKFDLILVTAGLGISLLTMLIISPSTIRTFIICLIPGLVCSALVVPIPNYHNIFVVFKEMIDFFYKRRNFKWEGWCSKDEFK